MGMGLLRSQLSKMATWCIASLRRILADLSIHVDGRHVSVDALDTAFNQLEIMYRELAALDALGELDSSGIEALQLTGYALGEVDSWLHSSQTLCTVAYSSPLVYEGTVGRPCYDIPMNTLGFLVDCGFSVPQISDILCVSLRTIRRRMSEYGISIRAKYSTLTDEQLDTYVSAIQHEFPRCGNRQMQGHLRAQGIVMQQNRIRESQRRVDPEGCVMRRLMSINRRRYRVNGPLSLWHMDGNHKLIRCALIL